MAVTPAVDAVGADVVVGEAALVEALWEWVVATLDTAIPLR
jgi:hypothetical protein